MSNKGASTILIILFLCLTLSNCSLNFPSSNKPRINYFSKDNIINTKAEKLIELDLNQIQFTDWKIIAEYPVIGGNIKKAELVGDNLIIDQSGISSISLSEKRINWVKPEFTMYEYGGGIVDDNLICIKGFTGDIYNLDINSSETKWIYKKTDYLIKNPLSNARPRIKYVNSEIVLLENCYGPSSIPIQAIGTKTGRKIWEREVKIWGNIPELKTTSILYVNEKIMILKDEEYLIGINTSTGKEIWKIRINDLKSGFSLIESSQFFELNNGSLFCLSGNKEIKYFGYLIDPIKGYIVNKSINCSKNIHVINNSLYDEKLTDNKMYILGSEEDDTLSIVCIDLSRMQEEWRTVIGHGIEINEGIFKFYFFPEIKDKIFLLLNSHQNEACDGLYCFNKGSGSVEWMLPNCNTFLIKYRNFKLFYYKEKTDLPFSKEVECFDLTSGKILWNIQTPKDFIYDIGFVDNNIIINVHQNFFILIDPQTGKILKAFPNLEASSSFSYIKFFDKINNHILFQCDKKEMNNNDTYCIPKIIEVSLE